MKTEGKLAALRQALEEELTANPDDLSTHAAYADFLLEHGDAEDAVRGEFIGVQIALEDESRPAKERQRLRRREQILQKAHQRRWLGELAPFLLDGEVPAYQVAMDGFQQFPVFQTSRPPWLPEGEPFQPYQYGQLPGFRFRHGWLDQLHLPRLSLYAARVLRQTPECRLLSELTIDEVADYGDPAPEPFDGVPDREHSIGLCPLVGSVCLGNVRHFRLGPDQGDDYRAYNCSIHSSVVANIVQQIPRLEELYLFANGYDLNDLFRLPTLTRLRVLQVYHHYQVHRLQLLANNPAIRNLTHLLLHPHNVGNWWEASHDLDEPDGYRAEEGYLPLSVVRPLLNSPNLPRLAHLRLRVSSMGDEGCREIVRSGILKRLKTLDLRHGRITNEGARALAGCPDLAGLDRVPDYPGHSEDDEVGQMLVRRHVLVSGRSPRWRDRQAWQRGW